MWGAALGAGINGIVGMITAAQNNSYAKEAASRQYHYSQRSLKESPKAQRQGLEDAGYNPMLALGNLAGGSYSGSGQMAEMQAPDLVGGAKAAAQMVQDVMKGYKLQNKKTEKEIENLESDLDTKETQRLQTEANASLLQSQAERTDLAYGRDIVDTALGIAGTGSSLYSAKAMSDVAKQNAAVNARNAAVNERRLDTHTTETHYDSKGNKRGSTERMTFSHGEPMIEHSADPKSKSNAIGLVGGSSKSSGSFAKQVAKELLLESVIGTVGAGAGALAADNLKRDLESGNHWNPKDRKNGKEKARRKWSLYHDIGF